MRICVIGGGNIGTLISTELSLNKDNEVRLLATRASDFSKEILIEDWNDNIAKKAEIFLITNDKQKAIDNAEIIFITVPASVLQDTVDSIIEFIQPGMMLGVIPGSGGVEFICKKLIDKGVIFFGLQRVPSIARIKEYGKIVINQSRKKQLSVSAIPRAYTDSVAKLLEKLFNIPCESLYNYLSVTLTPSNPILHTTRLYSIFKDYEEGTYYPRNILFYEEWNDDSSNILIKCDSELQDLCAALDMFDMTGVKSLKDYYEVKNSKEMTKKIRSIKAFHNIMSPMLSTDKGFIPDYESRYFTADFPYGLCVIKGIAEMMQVKTPNIDTVIKWYEKFAHKKYFIDDKFFGEGTGIPQNYNIRNRNDFIKIYKE